MASQTDEESANLRPGWRKMWSEDGDEFYHNDQTDESQWEPPLIEDDKEQQQQQSAAADSTAPHRQNVEAPGKASADSTTAANGGAVSDLLNGAADAPATPAASSAATEPAAVELTDAAGQSLNVSDDVALLVFAPVLSEAKRRPKRKLPPMSPPLIGVFDPFIVPLLVGSFALLFKTLTMFIFAISQDVQMLNLVRSRAWWVLTLEYVIMMINAMFPVVTSMLVLNLHVEYVLREWWYYRLMEHGALLDFRDREKLSQFVKQSGIFWYVLISVRPPSAPPSLPTPMLLPLGGGADSFSVENSPMSSLSMSSLSMSSLSMS